MNPHVKIIYQTILTRRLSYELNIIHKEKQVYLMRRGTNNKYVYITNQIKVLPSMFDIDMT